MNSDETKEIQTQVEGITLKTNIQRVKTIALFIILGGFGAFLIWATFAPLDEGVVAPGVITVMSYRKTVQHKDGGIVQEILVAEGDKVKEGQVLIRLNDALPKANLAAVKSEYLSALAIESRLLSERALSESIRFHPELLSARSNPEVAELMSRQVQLFNTRRSALENEKKILRESIKGLKEYITGLEELQRSRAIQIDLLTKEMQSLSTLAEEGYYPKSRILEMQRQIADLTGKRSEDLANIERARRGITELEMKIVLREQEFLKEVEFQLTEVQKRLSALKDQYVAAMDVLQRTEIRAPESGIVLGLRIHTIGGVISPGQPILDIVPQNAELVVEARVMPHDIDKVRKGLNAELRFSAFKMKNTPVAEGEVILVSPDRLIDQTSGIPYYLCKVRLTDKAMKAISGLELQPGMPVEVILKTGKRTFLRYLLSPLLDRIAVSFKEP